MLDVNYVDRHSLTWSVGSVLLGMEKALIASQHG
jgi:hypothetical protein